MSDASRWLDPDVRARQLRPQCGERREFTSAEAHWTLVAAAVVVVMVTGGT